MIRQCAVKQSANTAQEQVHHGITEVILPDERDFTVVMPTLAFLSHRTDHRWVTWILPDGITKSLLLQYQFDLSRIRLVHPRSKDEIFLLYWKALTTGTSHTVIGSPGKLSDNQISQLETAAHIGRCTGLLLRPR